MSMRKLFFEPFFMRFLLLLLYIAYLYFLPYLFFLKWNPASQPVILFYLISFAQQQMPILTFSKRWSLNNLFECTLYMNSSKWKLFQNYNILRSLCLTLFICFVCLIRFSQTFSSVHHYEQCHYKRGDMHIWLAL